MPTRRMMSMAFLRASRAEVSPCARNPSAICHPTGNTGFSAVDGSWNTMAASRPRTACSCAPDKVTTSPALVPSLLVRITAPRVVAVSGSSRRIVLAVTVFPLPLSPTIASTSPAPTVRLTPSTAITAPASVAKETPRPRMSRTVTGPPARSVPARRARRARRRSRHRARRARRAGTDRAGGPVTVLDIRGLGVSFATDAGAVIAVDGVSLTVGAGEVLAIVGESGSGKTVTAKTILRLLPETATTRGAVILTSKDGTSAGDVVTLSGAQLQAVRGRDAAMVFQEPSTALNPVFPVGWQIAEGLRAHGLTSAREARKKAIDIMRRVGIPDPESRVDHYPHQFSGGQKQRIVIAQALVLDPGVIIADEPTTALDVTVQAEILDLLRRCRDEFGTAIVLITHNMGIVADLADRVAVMYEGRIVEQADVRTLFASPKEVYTQQLLAAVPRLGEGLVRARDRAERRPAGWDDHTPVVEARDLRIVYPGRLRRPDFTAVDGVSLSIRPGEVLGLVGE